MHYLMVFERGFKQKCIWRGGGGVNKVDIEHEFRVLRLCISTQILIKDFFGNLLHQI